jgi:hypothetical protein
MSKILYAFLISPMCAMCSTHFILLDLINHLVKSENYEHPHYVIFSVLLLPLS